jgi:hypothetical protein
MEQRTIAGNQYSGFFQNGYGDQAFFSRGDMYTGPSSCALDPTHRFMYIADGGNNMIRTLDLVSYKVDTLVPGFSNAGVAGALAGGIVDGVGSNVRFIRPTGIAIDPTGALLYTADYRIGYYIGCLRETNITNTSVRTVAGCGGFTPAHQSRAISIDAVGTNAMLGLISNLAIDGDSVLVCAHFHPRARANITSPRSPLRHLHPVPKQFYL